MFLVALNCFLKELRCGRDDFRAQLFLDSLCGYGFDVARDLLRAITTMINL